MSFDSLPPEVAARLLAGETVAIKQGRRTVARLEPTALPVPAAPEKTVDFVPTRGRLRKMTPREYVETYLEPRTPRPDRDFTALLRADRDRE